MDPLILTSQLNVLLQAIHLPFTLQSPVELTPSLLIAILESILNVRIPIAHAKDEEEKDCEGVDGRVTPSQNSQLRTIKIFLGVLETDILQMDVGLSKLDPRLLAAGSWDEVVYVAEVLCWIGEELGLIEAAPVVDKGKGRDTEYSEQSTDSLNTPLVKAPTQSPSSTVTFLPPFTEASPPPTPTTTTLLFATDVDDTIQTDFTSPLATSSPLRQLPNPSTGRSPPIHNSSYIPKDDSSFTRQIPPIRRTGYISLVDHEAELSSFAHSLSLSTLASYPITTTINASSSSRNRTRMAKTSFHITRPRSSTNIRAITTTYRINGRAAPYPNEPKTAISVTSLIYLRCSSVLCLSIYRYL
ncbi:hypothetical protein AN958_06464 [Leucoagaricus sp. SymC.cos]|nr:hypothetical protein AN958_06464 [Leucoagaricus sp. SymC.cos]